jgi:flavodoxin
MITPYADSGLKILVAYYSYSGSTRKIAQRLREKTYGVLYPLDTAIPYSSHTIIKDAKRELEQGNLPALKYPIPSMSSYDLILVGGPVWWYTVATPLMSFLRSADFADRKVAAFCTHKGGVGSYFQDFQRQAKNAEILDGLELYIPRRLDNRSTDDALNAWLGKFGILPCNASTSNFR